jgi:hypothetical protein
MRIMDYESTKSLTDVGLVLTRDEAEELFIYLHRMLDKNQVRKAFLTEYHGCSIERELSVTIEQDHQTVQLSA